MKRASDNHFKALKQINSTVKRIVLFDFDEENSFHPENNNPVIKEWNRKNIENYLLVPDAWKKAVLDVLNKESPDLFTQNFYEIIDTFFEEQNLTLPKGFDWKNVKANIFKAVDGKSILFENSDSLFHRLKAINDLKINREKVSNNMAFQILHQDVHVFFDELSSIIE